MCNISRKSIWRLEMTLIDDLTKDRMKMTLYV